MLGRTSVQVVADFYGNDIDPVRLELHRDMMLDITKAKSIALSNLHDIVMAMRYNSGSLPEMLPGLATFLRIVLTVPVSTCTAERSFSTLRRLKSYLRNSMSQTRLNTVAVCNIHRDLLEEINLDLIANDLITRSSQRLNTFTVEDIQS